MCDSFPCDTRTTRQPLGQEYDKPQDVLNETRLKRVSTHQTRYKKREKKIRKSRQNCNNILSSRQYCNAPRVMYTCSKKTKTRFCYTPTKHSLQTYNDVLCYSSCDIIYVYTAVIIISHNSLV